MAIFKALLLLAARCCLRHRLIEAPIPENDVETLDWNIHLDPRDALITLSGTVEEVTSKAKKLNPRWARDIEKREPTRDHEAHLQARDWAYRVACVDEKRWKKAMLSSVQEGLESLTICQSLRPSRRLVPGPEIARELVARTTPQSGGAMM
ncbi:hypothetical protein E4U61_002920 [Claviceps capensis]|nr:hypothetical protein E4U61_002920 [Claviceps capensis]